MTKLIIRTMCIAAFINGCASVPTTPDTRSNEERKADLSNAIDRLSGEYDVVESRNEIYLNHNFALAKSLKVTSSRGYITVTLFGRNNSELVIVGQECAGNNHKLSTNFFCRKASSGMSYVSFGEENHEFQIKSGALIGGFPPLNIHTGDFLLDFSESGSGRPHYYTLRKK